MSGMTLLTVRDAAARLGVGYSTLKQWIFKGRVRTTQTEGGHHRISEAEIERLMARHSPEASAVLFKSASGAYEHVPFVKVTNLSRAMAELKDYGFRIAGLDSEAPDDIAAIDASPPIAIVLGAEGKGLRKLTRDSCDHLVRLDMQGPIKSLNVSNACAVSLYALTR